MASISLPYRPGKLGDTEFGNILTRQELDLFTADMLGVGDLSATGKLVQALVAIVDLEGFTSFCDQTDPHLDVPDYMSKFLDWLFKAVAKHFIAEETDDLIGLYGHLPYYSKFMGDGVMFLWDTSALDKPGIGNIVVDMVNVVNDYEEVFLPSIIDIYPDAPKKLRCGISRGQIVAIGDGQDYIGPCINVASRLQKIGGLGFAFNKKGFDESYFAKEVAEKLVLLKTPIRGLLRDGLIYTITSEYEKLGKEEKGQFITVKTPTS